MLTDTELFEFLEKKYLTYNSPSFIVNDPVSIPHRFNLKEDIEIIGFLVATLSWGQRKTILKNGRRLAELMDNAPHDFITNFEEIDLQIFNTFFHRTFNGIDCKYFLVGLKHIYKKNGSIYNHFKDSLNVHNLDISNAISRFRKEFFSLPHPKRTVKHLADPLKNSSAKRICMYLRWMIRKDNYGVDFGIWKDISPSKLVIPLDLHSGRIARSLGLLIRKQNDWKAVMELTNKLRTFDPLDPVKYDFALFGTGINEKF